MIDSRESKPRTAEDALAAGWSVDRSVYPWRAYLGPWWDPEVWTLVYTPEFKPAFYEEES